MSRVPRDGAAATVVAAVLLVAAGAGASMAALTARRSPLLLDAGAWVHRVAERTPIRRWDARHVRAALGTPGLVIVDARDGSVRRRPGPRGAVPLTRGRRSEGLVAAWPRLLGTRLLVVGSADDPGAARGVARFLADEVRYASIAVFRGGFEAWTEAGLPCDLAEATEW